MIKRALAILLLGVTAVLLVPVLAFAGPNVQTSVHGAAFYDFNSNGVLDADEPLAQSLVIATISRPGGSKVTTVYSESGDYAFNGLLPGAYVVTVQVAPVTLVGGIDASAQIVLNSYAVTTNPYTVILHPGQSVAHNVGFGLAMVGGDGE